MVGSPSASNAIYGCIKCIICSHDIPHNMISDQEENVTARKKQVADLHGPHWATRVSITLKAARQREEWAGEMAGATPRRAPSFSMQEHVWILLQQTSQIWRPRAGNEDSTSHYETWCYRGTSLVVQWLRVHVPDSGGPGLIPGQRTRFHMPQMKITKIQCSQINKQT